MELNALKLFEPNMLHSWLKIQHNLRNQFYNMIVYCKPREKGEVDKFRKHKKLSRIFITPKWIGIKIVVGIWNKRVPVRKIFSFDNTQPCIEMFDAIGHNYSRYNSNCINFYIIICTNPLLRRYHSQFILN